MKNRLVMIGVNSVVFILTICSALAVTNAQRGVGPHGLDACKLLSDATHATGLGLNSRYLSQGSTWLSCEYTDIQSSQNLLNAKWRIGFGFVPFTSLPEAQKSWQETYGSWQGKSSESASSSTSVSRLRFFGADEAFLVETTRTDPQPGSREAMVYWRAKRATSALCSCKHRSSLILPTPKMRRRFSKRSTGRRLDNNTNGDVNLDTRTRRTVVRG